MGLGLGVACSFAAGNASAHVLFDTPRNGAVLVVGQSVTLTWTDVIPHNTSDYDIDVLVNGQSETIVHDLAPAVHSYEWTVPDQVCTDCLLEIWQRNPDYIDFYSRVTIQISKDGEAVPTHMPDNGDGEGATASAPDGGAVADAAVTNDAVDTKWQDPTLAAVPSPARERSSGCSVVSGPSSHRTPWLVALLGSILISLRRRIT